MLKRHETFTTLDIHLNLSQEYGNCLCKNSGVVDCRTCIDSFTNHNLLHPREQAILVIFFIPHVWDSRQANRAPCWTHTVRPQRNMDYSGRMPLIIGYNEKKFSYRMTTMSERVHWDMSPSCHYWDKNYWSGTPSLYQHYTIPTFKVPHTPCELIEAEWRICSSVI